jgi:uncharacterized protein (TIGR03083 family)
MGTPTFDEMLGLIAHSSQALRRAVDGRLDVPVPSCPGWTGRNLVLHLGEVQRSWAAVVAAGPADGPPEEVREQEPDGELFSWATASTDALLGALAFAGPSRGCWTWWGEPRTAGAVARHQVQEAAVHAWDAQATAGKPEPLPSGAAVDGVDEFLSVYPQVAPLWPHSPATVGLTVDDDDSGDAWTVSLSDAGVAVLRRRADADVILSGSASDLVLALYRRIPPTALRIAGDADQLNRFLAWSDLS